MQKRIETENFVLELKNPEKTKGIAIAVCMNNGEEKTTTNGGVVGDGRHCLIAAETVISALVEIAFRDGASEDDVMRMIAVLGDNAMQRAINKENEVDLGGVVN